MLWIVACFVLLLTGAEPALAADAANCTACHVTQVQGAHAGLACSACHGEDAGNAAVVRLAQRAEERCRMCHPGMEQVLLGPMHGRSAEKAFVARSFGREDPHFFEANCNGCHVEGCLDCHGGDGHSIARPQRDDCAACHRGYFIGADYYGLAPREDALRYQRGPSYGGEHYLKMLPDVHAEAGLACGDCHDMASLAAGRKTGKGCRDCHTPDPAVIEHSIAAHLDKLECAACHAAWAPQEYGTFYLRDRRGDQKQFFRLRDQAGEGYLKSAYLRRQDAPPLGLDAAGKVSPIRPQFIAYFSELGESRPAGVENRLLAAEWRAFTPHTIRRGTPLCDACHDNPARFVQEDPVRRIYQPDRDGMTLESFWNVKGQRVVNGSFFSVERVRLLRNRSPEYVRKYLERWQSLIENVDASSPP